MTENYERDSKKGRESLMMTRYHVDNSEWLDERDGNAMVGIVVWTRRMILGYKSDFFFTLCTRIIAIALSEQLRAGTAPSGFVGSLRGYPLSNPPPGMIKELELACPPPQPHHRNLCKFFDHS